MKQIELDYPLLGFGDKTRALFDSTPPVTVKYSREVQPCQSDSIDHNDTESLWIIVHECKLYGHSGPFHIV